ncbi:MAG: spermidine/putrescine ABC transporter substrate-binding protein [Clostridia bacterium]|nr:spermidine/putrescine ABC transporter substrate-binding protein [Clostridia bacterium]
MKKFVLIAVILLAAVLAFSCEKSEEDSGGAVTLYVYNWGEYISDGSEESVDVNAEFENYCKETLGINVKVNYSTYSSNEDLYAKLASGTVSYDVVFPSDYMVARLAKEGLIQKFDVSSLENYGNIDDNYKNLYYDPENEYSVPYTFGTVGIIYNTEIVDEDDPDLAARSWSLMWSEKYTGNILQFNNPRDGFGTAQFYLGYDVNSENPEEWRNALELLRKQKSVVQGYVMDEVFNKMKGGSAAVCTYYAGDFLTMYEDNDRLAFYHPVEGTNVFIDAMCIPTSSGNPGLAAEYINFMLDTDIAIANAEYIYYASPNKTVAENEEYIEYMNDIYPDAVSILYDIDMSNMQFYYDLPDEIRDNMNSLWEELKIESTIGTSIFVICGVIVAACVACFVWRFAVKKKREYCFKKYSV